MFTRKEYMDGDCSHEDYYGQFANNQVTQIVIEGIGLAAIKRSRDPHMHDIPLRYWDRLVPRIRGIVEEPLKQAGDSLSLANGVCILKAAARQFKGVVVTKGMHE